MCQTFFGSTSGSKPSRKRERSSKFLLGIIELRNWDGRDPLSPLSRPSFFLSLENIHSLYVGERERGERRGRERVIPNQFGTLCPSLSLYFRDISFFHAQPKATRKKILKGASKAPGNNGNFWANLFCHTIGYPGNS